MRLVNIKTNKPIVIFEGGETVFYNKFLEKEMRLVGIDIPHGVRSLFDGRDKIFLEDAQFQRAFKEIYYITAMDHTKFQWKNN